MGNKLLYGCALASLTATLLSACGDNSRRCGPGTNDDDNDGVCAPGEGGGMVTCTGGTVLNPTMDGCVIDPNACQDGTVLVDNQCVDPGHVTANLEEAAEPNGLNLLFGENSGTSFAGEIALTSGTPFVIHGTIAPFQDSTGDGILDPDVDTYVIQVAGPTLLKMTADGLHGLAASFIGVANVDPSHPLGAWTRYGLAAASDTAKRDLFLPEGGVYLIGVTDTRSIFAADIAVGPAEGAPAYDYYITITDQAIAPETLTPTMNVATATGSLEPGQVKFYSTPMGAGLNSVVTEYPGVSSYFGSTVINNATENQTRVVVNEPANGIASVRTVGFKMGENALVAVDHIYDYAMGNKAYELTITTGGAAAFSRTGMAVTQTTAPADLSEFLGSTEAETAVFYYDVASENEITGMDLAWDNPVGGYILDENNNLFSLFTIDPFDGLSFDYTFDAFIGLHRHFTPGRYYFVVYVPGEDTPQMVTATSTIGVVTPTVVTPGTATAALPVDATFETNVLSYTFGTIGWHQFDVNGTNTGNVDVMFLDPDTAYGRLDPVTTDNPFGNADDPFPIFEEQFGPATAPVGRIVLDEDVTSYLALVNTANNTGTFIADFGARPHHDYGVLPVGNAPARMDEAIGVNEVKRYLVRTERDNEIEVTIHSDQVGVNTLSLQRVNFDESANGAAVTNATGDLVATYYQRANGWTAFTVSGTVATTFDLTVKIISARYTRSAGTTAFADACAGGTTHPLMTGMNPNTDDGITAAVMAPAGFTFFGAATTSFLISANGFLSFDATLTGSNLSNQNMPSTVAANAVIAPQWDDLDLVQVCSKTVNGKLVVQWTGEQWSFFGGGEAVEFQAILDPATDTIEFVYGPGNVSDGSFATVGVENQTGTKAKVIGFNEPVLGSGGFLLTPVP